MAFMEPRVEYGDWYEVETHEGTWFIPADVVGDLSLRKGWTYTEDSKRWGDIVRAVQDYCAPGPSEVKLIAGWGARMSAPGYLDCTEWAVFRSKREAQA